VATGGDVLGAAVSSVGRGDEACLISGDHCLCPIAEAELAEDVTDVRLYRLVAEHETVGDLLVREARCDEAESFNLAGCEAVEIPRVGALRGAEARKLGD
jgi:hypothetical protein